MKSSTRNILMFTWPVLLAGLIFLFYQFGASNQNTAGAKLYRYHCANCHSDDGTGLRGLYPPLSGADYLVNQEEGVACLIRNGASGPMIVNGRTYNQIMPGNQLLTDQEITILINYIRNSWENNLGEVPYAKVKEQLDSCKMVK